jgi:diguanylate cyclase (GGDEF)-like protein
MERAPVDKHCMRRRPTFMVPVGAAAVGVVVFAAPGTVVAETMYSCAFSALVVLAWLGVRAQSGPRLVAHALVAGALTAWLLGDLLYTLLTWTMAEMGDVSPADVLWVAGYPLLAAGLIKMTRLRAHGRLREALLDGLAMATVVATLFWRFMIEPAARDQPPSLAVLFGAFYPFGDVLLFATGAMLVLSPGKKRGPTRYLVAALTLTFFGDVSMSLAPAVFPSFDSAHLDGVLLLANSLFVAALRHPSAGQLSKRTASVDQRLHPARVLFLGLALLALPALAGLRASDAVVDRITLMISMMALTVIVLIRFLLVVREQEHVRTELAHQATHDQLTGLANRQALHARLDTALRRHAPGGTLGPVIHYLDLNGFKPINDEHGHAAGDAVLMAVAQRLRAAARAEDSVARLGGDEFVVLSENIDDPTAALALSERLRKAIATPVRHDGRILVVGASVGWACAADLAKPSADALLAAADAQMYFEKALHRRAPAPADLPAR